jgi:hypothetical protein
MVRWCVTAAYAKPAFLTLRLQTFALSLTCSVKSQHGVAAPLSIAFGFPDGLAYGWYLASSKEIRQKHNFIFFLEFRPHGRNSFYI